jgi:capsular polysaccharide transport system permease protein
VRKGFYPTYEASYASTAYGIGFGMFFLCLGLVFLRANYQRVLER